MASGKSTPSTKGFVYFLVVEGIDRVKIGKSVSPIDRMNGMAAGFPSKPRLLLLIEGAHYERLLHRRFADLRRHGEWFELGDALLDFIHARVQSSVTTMKVFGCDVPVAQAPEDPKPTPVHQLEAEVARRQIALRGVWKDYHWRDAVQLTAEEIAATEEKERADRKFKSAACRVIRSVAPFV